MEQETGISSYWPIGGGFGLAARRFRTPRKRKPPIRAKANCGSPSMTAATEAKMRSPRHAQKRPNPDGSCKGLEDQVEVGHHHFSVKKIAPAT